MGAGRFPSLHIAAVIASVGEDKGRSYGINKAFQVDLGGMGKEQIVGIPFSVWNNTKTIQDP